MTLARRLRRLSRYAPLLAKGVTIGIALLGMALIGAHSIEAGPGKPLDAATLREENRATLAALSGTWLAGRNDPTDTRRPNETRGPSAGPKAEPAGVAANHSTGQPSTKPSETTVGSEASARGAAAPTGRPGLTADGKVILNTAGLDELTRLPRVGPKRAAAILALRERLGRFKRATDLLRVKGIGPKTLRKMLPHLVLDPPADDETTKTSPPGAAADTARPPARGGA